MAFITEIGGRMYYQTTYISPLGDIIIVSDKSNLLGLWFKGQKYELGSLCDETMQLEETTSLKATKRWLDRYFKQENPSIQELKLQLIGNEFRQQVWKILCDIPYGEVVTYKEIANQVAKDRDMPTMSAQAVGGAVGHNPISIIIPCHRVVGSNHSFTGYAGGIDRKLKLLALEGVDIKKYHIPKKGTAL